MKYTTIPFLMVLALGMGGLAGCGEDTDVTEDNPPTAIEPATTDPSGMTAPPPETDPNTGTGTQ